MKNYPFYEEEINQNQEKDITKDKINKPKELIEFNVSPHFKENIIHSEKNCKELINENSYYCLTCKHSVCSICGINEHKNHLLIQRKNCLNYDTTFFNEISKLIEDSFLIEKKKDDIKKGVCNSIEKIKLNLDFLKEEKMNEIDKLFNQIYFSLNEIKKFYLNARETIENYYSKNKNFFNIILNNENGNIDLENTIFLMNFEIMNLCDNKNLEVLDNIIQIKNKVNEYDNSIKNRTEEIKNELNNYLTENYTFEKFDDFYWDIRLRTSKYTEQIQNFRNSVCEILKKTGSYDKIKDLLDIFDSKNKKGKDVIFNQEYFINDMGNESTTFRMKKIRGNSKNKISSSRSGNLSFYKSKQTFNSITKINQSTITNKNDIIQLTPDDIILDNRLTQRFFAYSIFELFGKYFDNYKNKELNNLSNQNLINNININSKKNNNKKNNKSTSNKNLSVINENYNSNLSVSFLSNWTSRFTQLKEYAKPVIGTNTISIFDNQTKKIKRIPIKLSKEEHGYNQFPDGCRHILVEDILYITGGVDSIKNPLNIVLSVNINTFELKKLNNLNNNHSYHSIEYLDNYDCLIVIGGELNSTCELFDIYSQKWSKIPDLNNSRANTNIYFDPITSDLYVLFGMEGNITEKNTYCDSIEVLELNDIKSGWIKVDYYKNADLNLKLNFCTVVPFTRDKLLIYGGNNSRVQKRLFAIFDMNKNECMKVDTQTMEQIKLEEKKIKFVDMALSKMN
jgi:hypothetical protein